MSAYWPLEPRYPVTLFGERGSRDRRCVLIGSTLEELTSSVENRCDSFGRGCHDTSKVLTIVWQSLSRFCEKTGINETERDILIRSIGTLAIPPIVVFVVALRRDNGRSRLERILAMTLVVRACRDLANLLAIDSSFPDEQRDTPRQTKSLGKRKNKKARRSRRPRPAKPAFHQKRSVLADERAEPKSSSADKGDESPDQVGLSAASSPGEGSLSLRRDSACEGQIEEHPTKLNPEAREFIPSGDGSALADKRSESEPAAPQSRLTSTATSPPNKVGSPLRRDRDWEGRIKECTAILDPEAREFFPSEVRHVDSCSQRVPSSSTPQECPCLPEVRGTISEEGSGYYAVLKDWVDPPMGEDEVEEITPDPSLLDKRAEVGPDENFLPPAAAVNLTARPTLVKRSYWDLRNVTRMKRHKKRGDCRDTSAGDSSRLESDRRAPSTVGWLPTIEDDPSDWASPSPPTRGAANDNTSSGPAPPAASWLRPVPEAAEYSAPTPAPPVASNQGPAPKETAEEFRSYVTADTKRLHEVGFVQLVKETRQRSDISNLENVHHKAKPLLKHYRYRGAPVKLSTEPWHRDRIDQALQRGAHKSCLGHINFLEEEFADMRSKGQWIVLRACDVKDLPGLRIAPPGVIEQDGRRPRTIVDFTFNGVNSETLPLAAMEAMQFGHALDRILREILLADPALGPVRLIKVDLSDGFYRVDLNIEDIPKLGMVLPMKEGDEPLIAFPLVLPMGWKNSPPIFSSFTETITDLANQRLADNVSDEPHPLDELAESVTPMHPLTGEPAGVADEEEGELEPRVDRSSLAPSPLATETDDQVRTGSTHPLTGSDERKPVAAGTSDAAGTDVVERAGQPQMTAPATGNVSAEKMRQAEKCAGSLNVPTPAGSNAPIPTERDPCLPATGRALSYVDIFVDDFIGLAQTNRNGRRVRRILLHAIDDVFRPNDSRDSMFRREPVSLKKLRKGDCSWSTVKEVLGWIIDTVNMTIALPKRRVERLSAILSSIPIHQKRTSVKKWHKVLGELRSMALALPGARHLFSHMQEALSNKIKGRVSLSKGVHDSLEDFRWLLEDIAARPTRIAELIPLLASAVGHHDASGAGAGGVWFPASTLQPREGYQNEPVVWRLKWPQHIIDELVSSSNPNGTISNSDLELAGGLIHLEALAQCFDTRERTLLSKTDNLNTLFWQRKASATTDKVPAHLLRMLGIHQRYHRYVPRHDYLSGPSNPVSDALSRDFHLDWTAQLAQLDHLFPEGSASCQIWEPSEQFVAAVLLALQKKRARPEDFLLEPNANNTSVDTLDHCAHPTLEWASSPLVKGSKTKLTSFKKSEDEFVLRDLEARHIPSSLERLKVTYGSVHRRPLCWGPSN